MLTVGGIKGPEQTGEVILYWAFFVRTVDPVQQGRPRCSCEGLDHDLPKTANGGETQFEETPSAKFAVMNPVPGIIILSAEAK